LDFTETLRAGLVGTVLRRKWCNVWNTSYWKWSSLGWRAKLCQKFILG